MKYPTKFTNFAYFFPFVDPFLSPPTDLIPKSFSLSPPSISIKNTGVLLSEKSIQSRVLKISQTEKCIPIIVPFKNSPKIEKICAKHSWLLAANSSHLCRSLEDKISFYNLCQRFDIPIVPSFTDVLNKENILRAFATFPKPIVIQTRSGWSGKSTYLIKEPSQYQHLTGLLGCRAKFSSFYSHSYTLTLNCCLYQGHLLTSPPAYQFTGIPPLTTNIFATVGRQWPSFAPNNIVKQINTISSSLTEKILLPLKYRGFFGLDFLITDNSVFLLECNPRLTASYSFYSRLEKRAGLIPLLIYHLASFTGQKLPSPPKNQPTLAVKGVQLVYKNSLQKIINSWESYQPLSFDPYQPSIPNHIMKNLTCA